jgi:hypothetical protein
MSFLTQFLILLAIHWLADFVLQTHWQAQNKSKNNEALLQHVSVYTVILTAGAMAVFFTADRVMLFVAANAVLHFATDYVTSRWSSRLYAKQDWHNFFVVIGLDQLIHQVTLASTMVLFFGSGQ